MKTKSFVFFTFLSFCFLISCTCNNDTPDITNKHPIHGVWNLSNVSGGFIGINIDYNPGEVIWTFNENNHQVLIANNINTTGPEDIYAGLESGNYSYNIEETENQEVLFIDGNEMGNILILDSTLTIDNGVLADGFLTTFTR